MAAGHHLSLFHPRLVRERMNSLPEDLVGRHADTVAVWIQHLKEGTLDATKEVSLHGPFLDGIFGDVLGYRTMAHAASGKWELHAEAGMMGGSADAAIGLFDHQAKHIVAPVELKGATQYLDVAKGRTLTPIQQAWDYANKAPESQWIVVSNYRETRLYAKSRGPGAYELFSLEDLAEAEGLRRFVALLGRDALLGGSSPTSSPLANMLIASERAEKEITEQLYDQYRALRTRLFEHLRMKSPHVEATDLLRFTQTILDRVLFIAFAEDRGLLPPDTLKRAYTYRDPYNPRPPWQNFLTIFRSVNTGNHALGIHGYNGGLFADTHGIDDLEIDDELVKGLTELGDYNFKDEVSVDVLGHIFEQSITDLEALRREAVALTQTTPSDPPPAAAAIGTQKRPSKRKREGIFYTPAFVTAYLVESTVGAAIKEAWERAGVEEAKNKADKITAWTAYQEALRDMRVLDPSCGSGAFLVAVYDALAHEFDRAAKALEPLRGKQTLLGEVTRAVLNENLFGIDKSEESVEITKLSLWLKTAAGNRKLTYLDRNIRWGNSVVTDKRVDPLAFDWNKGESWDQMDLPSGGEADAEIDARWHEGFDVVIGNPPYVRHELLGAAQKEHWEASYQTFDGTADLFVYFFERGIRQLKPGGRLGFIVSNKWMRGGYAQKLRAYLTENCTIETMVDFGHAPIFPDADAFPCIIVVRKNLPGEEVAPGHEVQVTQYPRDELGKELLANYIRSHRFGQAQSSLLSSGWTLEIPGVRTLLEKLRGNGVPLGQHIKGVPLRGVLTGLNEAFLVDSETKERLVREDANSAPLFRKFLRGQDVARWSPKWAGMWLIRMASSANTRWPWSMAADDAVGESLLRASYPSLYAHLKRFESKLRPRSDQGQFWWELRSCAYYEAFEKPKLVYQEIQFHPAYALDREGLLHNNKVYLLPTDDPWLLAVLNSPAMWWHNWRHLVHLKDEALTPATEKLIQVPIPPVGANSVDAEVDLIASNTRDVQAALAATHDLLRVQYDVNKVGEKLGDFPSLSSDDFVDEVRKRRPKNKALTPATLRELRVLFEDEVPPILAKRAAILAAERRIAATVHAAYGLTDADLALMRETAPPRMPQGWD